MTVDTYIKKEKEKCKEYAALGFVDLEECEKEPVKHPLILKHVEMFGVEPNCIGMIQDLDRFDELLKEAIEKGEPYDEYKMLSEEEREAYDRGELLF